MPEPRVAGQGSVASPAEMRATPQNPLLGLLARALYKARDVLSPAPGSLAHRKGFNISDWTLGDMPEEVENWSYGNTPFAVPQLSRIPQAKTTVVERDGKKERKNRAFMALDASPLLPFGALDNLAGGAVKGAIRLGGKETPTLVHTTPTSDFDKIESIRDKGLYAPSLGLISETRNGYQGHNPTLVWRAGELDRQLPDSLPPGIFNRDAFVWNPSRHDADSIVDQYKKRWVGGDYEKRLNSLTQDARLTQMLPDSGSHTASVLASPNFRSLAEWENSPVGFGALESQGGGPLGLQTVRNYEYVFQDLARKHGITSDEQMRQILEQFPHLAKQQDLNTSMLRGSPLGDLYETARNAPSNMGEMKIYAPSVPASPNEVSVFNPGGDAWSQEIWTKGGYNVYSPEQLAGLAGKSSVDRHRPPIHALAPSTGLAPPSPAEAQRMWDDLQGIGRSMVGAPGLKAPAASWPPGINQPFAGMVGHNAAPEVEKALSNVDFGFGPLVDAAEAAGKWKAPALDEYGLWPEITDWFKNTPSPSFGTLPQHLGNLHDLDETQMDELLKLWNAPGVTGVQAAQNMQKQVQQWKDASAGKTIDIDAEWQAPAKVAKKPIKKTPISAPTLEVKQEVDAYFANLPFDVQIGAKSLADYFGFDESTGQKVYDDWAGGDSMSNALQTHWFGPNSMDEADTGQKAADAMKAKILEWKGGSPSTDFPDLDSLPDPETDIAAQLAAKAADKNFGFPEGHPAILMFKNPQDYGLSDLAEAVKAVPKDITLKSKFLATGKKLGLTPEESQEAYEEWLGADGVSSLQIFLKYFK